MLCSTKWIIFIAKCHFIGLLLPGSLISLGSPQLLQEVEVLDDLVVVLAGRWAQIRALCANIALFHLFNHLLRDSNWVHAILACLVLRASMLANAALEMVDLGCLPAAFILKFCLLQL